MANRPVRDLAFEHTGFTFLVTENALAQVNSSHKKFFWSLAQKYMNELLIAVVL